MDHRRRLAGGVPDPAALETLIGTGFKLYSGLAGDGELEYRPGFMIVDGNSILRRGTVGGCRGWKGC